MRARRLTPSRAITLAAVVLWLLAIGAISQANAAQLTVNASTEVSVFTDSKCTEGLTVNPVGPYQNGYYYQVEILGIPETCNGLPLIVMTFDDDGDLIDRRTTTATTGTMTVYMDVRGNYAYPYNPNNVDSAVVIIDTWPIPTVWGPTAPPPPISAYRLQSFNYRDHFVRHTGIDNQAIIEEDADQLVTSEFRVVDGLASGGDTRVSFESVDHPGYYLRRSGDELVLDDGGYNFAQDATFIQEEGLADDEWWSFRSVSDTDLYIRHQYFDMWLHNVGAGGLTQVEREDTTFRFVKVD